MTGGSSCTEVVRSLLRAHSDHQGPHCCVELFLDFAEPVPTDQERHLYELAEAVLAKAADLLRDVRGYEKGASDVIRSALQNPNDEEMQKTAQQVIGVFAARIRAYYDLSLRIKKLVPLLLWDLCSGPLSPDEQLRSRQALTRQFARLVDFVLEFDYVKVCTTALQNDFSFYRRSTGRDEKDPSLVGLANEISLFLAYPSPMLNALSAATTEFVQAHPSLERTNTTSMLATIVSVCGYMVREEETTHRLDDATGEFCVRVMVGCIVLYDHVDDKGAFHRDSLIDIKKAIQIVRENSHEPQTLSLLNAIRYLTKNFKSETTPKSVKQSLA
ncbi:unnamed protein product, partial [Mesorhabditis spiculigera]